MLLFTHPSSLEHQVAEGHPERPQRIQFLLDHLQQVGFTQDHEVRQAGSAAPEDILRAHTQTYVGQLEAVHAKTQSGEVVPLDPDTWMGPGSMAAANYAAGALCDAVDAVLAGETDTAFCAVRPPGHHAERDAAMGFCIYNSIAVAALRALAREDIQRIAVLDFDVHHGNGTVEILRDHPGALVCSTLQHPFYPHRFYENDWSNVINSPLPAGSNGSAFRRAVEADWLPALARHKPQLILVSAGFDAHREDPLAQLNLEHDDFTWVTELIRAQAREFADGRVVSTLEGGYDLEALAQSVSHHLQALV